LTEELLYPFSSHPNPLWKPSLSKIPVCTGTRREGRFVGREKVEECG
jgi:hypothetical protein